MYDDEPDSPNFWPAFSDAMLAIILTLLLAIGVFQILYREGVQDVEKARRCQDQLRMATKSEPGVTVEADPQDQLLLHVTFSDKVLFADDDAKLNDSGRNALDYFGLRLKEQLVSIVEIQIRGHADTRRSVRFPSNLHLASERANAVFEYLQTLGFSPVTHTISALSYGEFYPATRRAGTPFTPADLVAANATPEKRGLNRRIELLIRYGRNMTPCQAAPIERANR